jgi:hypothetical protein
MADQPALADPRLDRALLDREGRLARPPVLAFWRRGRVQRERADLERIRHILGRYPWREYRYRYGRWQRTQRIVDLGFPSFKWARTYDTFQLLDPVSGRPVAELVPRQRNLEPPGGVLWFAGDPGVAGVYASPSPSPGGAPPGDGAGLGLALSAFAGEREAFAEAMQLDPHRASPLGGQRHQGQLLADDERRPWLADQPGRPR